MDHGKSRFFQKLCEKELLVRQNKLGRIWGIFSNGKKSLPVKWGDLKMDSSATVAANGRRPTHFSVSTVRPTLYILSYIKSWRSQDPCAILIRAQIQFTMAVLVPRGAVNVQRDLQRSPTPILTLLTTAARHIRKWNVLPWMSLKWLLVIWHLSRALLRSDE